MEEQRQRQEDEARRATVVSAAEAGVPSPTAEGEREAGQPSEIMNIMTISFRKLPHSFIPAPVLLK